MLTFGVTWYKIDLQYMFTGLHARTRTTGSLRFVCEWCPQASAVTTEKIHEHTF